MADPYVPLLEEFEFTADEKHVIEAALATEKPWDWKPAGKLAKIFKAVKTKILNLHLERHGNRCCYCRVNLHGAGHFMIDREHVLPKSLAPYRSLAFTIWNLGIACKRCNMQYKVDKDDFVVVKDDAVALADGANYRLIHPNFDRYRDHLARSALEANDTVIVKYTKVSGSEKGAFTYDYFNLKGLEIGSFDQAQGAQIAEDPGEAGLMARSLAEEFGQ
jgi:hypothetical protein